MPATPAHSIILKKEDAHEVPIYCCAWTKTNVTDNPNGPSKEFIITGGFDGLVKVWKFENYKLELSHTLASHTLGVVSVAVSLDGYSIASTSIDSSLIIWDLLSGEKMLELETEPTEVWKVTFSPDGTQVATGSHTGKIVIYNIKKNEKQRALDTRGKFVLCVAWSSNGKYLASGAVDGLVCLFDVAQGKLLHSVEAHHAAVRSVTFSLNSKALLTTSDDGKVNLYNVESANLQSTLTLPCWATYGAISPDGTRVAVAAADGSVRVASLIGLTVLNIFREHSDTAWGLQFNATSNMLVSVSKDKSINVYECPVPPKNVKK